MLSSGRCSFNSMGPSRSRAEVSGAWAARAAARQALEAFRAGGLATTSELLQRAEVSYREGAFTIMDLLDAYRSVWDARSQVAHRVDGRRNDFTQRDHFTRSVVGSPRGSEHQEVFGEKFQLAGRIEHLLDRTSVFGRVA